MSLICQLFNLLLARACHLLQQYDEEKIARTREEEKTPKEDDTNLVGLTLTWGGESLVKFPSLNCAQPPQISWHVNWLSDGWRHAVAFMLLGKIMLAL